MKFLLNFLFIIICSLGLMNCNKPKGYKTKSGLILYVFSDHHPDSTTAAGSILKLRYTKTINDSIVETNRYSMPSYETVLPPFAYPHEPGEVYSMFRPGDSIILVQSADSLLKKSFYYSVPDYVKKGQEIKTYYKVLDVFANDSLAIADQEKEFRKVIAYNRDTGPDRLKTYLKEKGIQAEMTSDSLFIETLKKGTGEKIDSSDQVSVRFILKTLSGEKIAENVDTADSPTLYLVGSGNMLPGIDQGLCHLKKGDHARIYLPAMKGFGVSAPPGSEKGFQDLVFEVNVLTDTLSSE